MRKPLLILTGVFGLMLLIVLVKLARPPAVPRQPRTAVSGSDYPLVLVDPSGVRLELKRAPRRIVSVTLGTDELLLALVEPARIAGLTHLVDDPRQSWAGEAARSVAHRVTSNAEEILAARPDLVLVASYTRAEQVQLLARSGAPVYRFGKFDTFEDLQDNIRVLARLCGVRARGAALVAELDRRLAAVARRIPAGSRPRVLYLTESLWTAGQGTTVHDVLVRAGAVNIAAEQGRTGWRKISAEEVIAWNPEVVISQTVQPTTVPAHEWLGRQPGLAGLSAVKQRRVWAVPARSLTSVSHHVVRAVEEVNRVLFR